MEKNKIAFFLPTRSGSQRVVNKNTKNFAGIQGGLLKVKLDQLIKTKNFSSIILSTNDKECIEIAEAFKKKDSRLQVVERPNELCLDTTNLQDLIKYVPTITDAEHIVWGHVTTPIADSVVYDAAVEEYLKQKDVADSLVSVVELKNFLLNSSGKLINNTTELPWPRTQDLEPLYEINHVMFIARRDVYEKQCNRIGINPILYKMDKIKSFDIDWPEDFQIAEILYKDMYL